jgi:hypothetical protein
MLARMAIPAVVVFGAAWALVQPDTPRPETATTEQVAIEAPATSAVALLGETWTVDAPPPPAPTGPVIRPLTAEEHAAAIAAMQRPPVRSPDTAETVARVEPLRRPVPRPAQAPRVAAVSTTSPVVTAVPAGSIVVVGPGGRPLSNPPPVIVLREGRGPAMTRADTAARWVVRQQGSGAVIAELPLDEALAILTSR